MELRQTAYQAFICSNIEEKIAIVDNLNTILAINTIAKISAKLPNSNPGLPAKPELRETLNIEKRSPFTPAGHAALIHAICHIEFNAINLAVDAIWRFNGMPEQFYKDWAQVAKEEAYHFTLLQEHLKSIPYDTHRGYAYGDFPAHTGLRDMCIKTSDDIVARMALVPRTLEARGLDATPLIQTKLRKVKTAYAQEAIAILDIILRDEIGHVAVGNYWYRWLCQRYGLDPMTHYVCLYQQHTAPKLRAPFNLEARIKAGFTQAEIDFLTAIADKQSVL